MISLSYSITLYLFINQYRLHVHPQSFLSRLHSDRSLCSQAQRPWEQPRTAPERAWKWPVEVGVCSYGWHGSVGFEQHLGPSLVFPKLLFVSSAFTKHRKIEVLVTEARRKNVRTHFQLQAQLSPKLGPQALTLSFLMICSKLGMRKPIFLRCSCPKRLAWCRTTLTHPTCHPNLRRMLKCTT